MKLWLISQDENVDYDTYSDAVVAAETEEEARKTHPQSEYDWKEDPWLERHNYTWCKSPEAVKVEYLGNAKGGTPAGVICASFHAG